MIAPTPLQCDSPKVVTRKIVPKVDMPLGYGLRSPHDDLQAAIVMPRRPMVTSPSELSAIEIRDR